MNKLFTVSALVVSSLAGVAATAGLAAAEDGKRYPAFGCVEAGTGGGSTINRNEVRITKSAGGVDETAIVLCPIVRDEQDPADNNRIYSAVVHAFDTIFNKNLSCTLNARSYEHGPISYQTQATTGVDSAGSDLVFTDMHVDNIPGGQSAHYYFQCQVPTNQGVEVVKIYSYEVTER